MVRLSVGWGVRAGGSTRGVRVARFVRRGARWCGCIFDMRFAMVGVGWAVAIGLELGFLLEVGALGFFEDVDEMFALREGVVSSC